MRTPLTSVGLAGNTTSRNGRVGYSFARDKRVFGLATPDDALARVKSNQRGRPSSGMPLYVDVVVLFVVDSVSGERATCKYKAREKKKD